MTVKDTIEQKLHNEFKPLHLEVHHEHNIPPFAGNLERGSSHFKVVIVANQFIGERLSRRHRAITRLLADELIEYVDALALHTYTLSEWENLYDGDVQTPLLKARVNH